MQLKEGHNYLQKEIGGYLYDNYVCFMKTSESLKSINHEFEELKTMLSQYDLLIGGLKSQMDQFSSGIHLNEDDLKALEEDAGNDIFTQCEVIME